ncbi:MAG: hypothetical protein WBA57_05625 [Elainellaceae cyanobacterium]
MLISKPLPRTQVNFPHFLQGSAKKRSRRYYFGRFEGGDRPY